MMGYGGGIVEALNARVYGNGTETLVLSHGFGADHTVWHLLLPYLACYFKLVVFDLAFAPTVRNGLYDPKRYSTYGSYAQDLVELMEQLNVANATYVGHSMSAMIGCIASVQKPYLFKHLVLLNGSPRYLNDKGYIGGFNMSDVEGILGAMKQNYSDWVPKFAAQVMGPNHATAVDEFKQSLERMKPEIAIQVAKTVFLSDYRWVLKQVKVPCTIIQSKSDVVVPQFVPAYMEKMLGGDTTNTKGCLEFKDMPSSNRFTCMSYSVHKAPALCEI